MDKGGGKCVMAEVYEQLARRLHRLTNGYPATESGVELKILRKIFSEEEAAYALKLRPYPERAEKLSQRFGRTVDETREILDSMAEKGQIGSFAHPSGGQGYMLSPFALGIWEYQVDHLDRELCDLADEYFPELLKTVGGHKPALSRVVPINKAIDADLQVLSYEDMRGLIERSYSFQLMDCICRKKKDLQGNRTCDHTRENCMVFLKQENALDYFNFAGRIISKEEALAVLEQTEEEGLVHCTYNTRAEQVWVCNCCSCCCDLLVGLTQHKSPHLLTRSNFLATVDEESCKACGVCAKKRCPTEAIIANNGSYAVLSERCIGCGVCVPACPTDSLKLIRQSAAEQDKPPADLKSWYLRRGLRRIGSAVKNRIIPQRQA